jgi:hypothetical protein
MYKAAKLGAMLTASLIVTTVMTGCSDSTNAVAPTGCCDLATSAARGVPGGPNKVCTITVSLSPATVSVGTLSQATGVVQSSNGKPVSGTVTWASANPAVATISSTGQIKTLSAGNAAISGSYDACSNSSMLTVTATAPAPATVANVIVAIDSASVAIGGKARAVATATDANGNVVTGQIITWVSQSPAVATVSSAGDIAGVTSGTSVIQAKVQTITGGKSIDVRVPVTTTPPPPPPPTGGTTANLKSVNFEDGTLGGLGTWNADKITVIGDPTGAGKGKIAKLHYTGSNGDDNTSLIYNTNQTFGGQSIYFRGEFYVPVSSLGGLEMQRKLVYFKQHEDWNKFPSTGGHRFRTVVKMFGNELDIDAVYEPESGSADAVRTYGQIAAGLAPNTWYTLEVQQTTETSLGAGNGILRVWLNGVLKFEKTNMRWSDPNWTGQSASELYWDTFMVGQQVNLNAGSFDEYRYWNNVEFSTQRIGN